MMTNGFVVSVSVTTCATSSCCWVASSAGLSFILHVGLVAVVVGSVVYDLSTAVGQQNMVVARGNVTLTTFLVSEIVSRRCVLYFV